MNDMRTADEMKSFWNALTRDDFDFKNAAKYLVTRASYHMTRTNENAVLDFFLSDRFIRLYELRRDIEEEVRLYKKMDLEEYFYTIAKTDTTGLLSSETKIKEQIKKARARNAVQQSTFWPIVITENFISYYEFWNTPIESSLDMNIPHLLDMTNNAVIGFWRDIDSVREAEESFIKHNLQLGTKDGRLLRYFRNETINYDELNHFTIADAFGCESRIPELCTAFENEPDCLFRDIGEILGFSTWFPKKLFTCEPDITKGFARVYRVEYT